ncbi:hypothetical protein MXB_4766 [Myxobolus squamalis]|nr:hypothetical protein MXB_4766 [Myxobolus squamalis]
MYNLLSGLSRGGLATCDTYIYIQFHSAMAKHHERYYVITCPSGTKITITDVLEQKKRRQERFGVTTTANPETDKIKKRLERFGNVEGCAIGQQQKIQQRKERFK